jgi:hypothetical protein
MKPLIMSVRTATANVTAKASFRLKLWGSRALALFAGSRLRALLVIFLVFCVSILFFAEIYLQVYLVSPSSFAMNSDIAAAQHAQWLDTLHARRRNKYHAAYVFSYLVEAIDNGKQPRITATYPNGAPREAELTAHGLLYHFVDTPKRHETKLTITADQRLENIYFLEAPLRNTSKLNSKIGIQSLWEWAFASIDDIISEYNEIGMPWRYPDFLYFSAITATTVGYGDMLPNATSIRMIVTSQVVFTSFIVMVAINVSVRPLSKRRFRSRPPPSRNRIRPP